MSSQLENLKKAIYEEAVRFKEIELQKDYLNIVVEMSPDPLAASLILTSYLVGRKKPFTLRFVDPLLSISKPIKQPYGVTFFIGYTGVKLPKESTSFEISCYSDPPTKNILNPYIFGLNGALIGSTTALTYLLLKELGYNPAELSSIVLGGIISSQATSDPDNLTGLNRLVLNELEKDALEVSNGLKIPMAEGLDLSVGLTLMLDPFVLGVSGDQKGSSLIVQELVKKKLLSKSSGIVTGNDARVLFDELSKIRAQNGFKEIQESTLLGPIYMDRRHPSDSPLRSILGVSLALEACSNLQMHEYLYKLFVCKKRELYKQILDIMLNYSYMATALTKQLMQSQEYFRETQNALYIFAPRQQKELILRVAKMISQSRTFNAKPVFVVSSINHWSYVVGYAGLSANFTSDLGSIFKTAAERSKGVGYGSAVQAAAYIPTTYVESFFDDVDVRLSD